MRSCDSERPSAAVALGRLITLLVAGLTAATAGAQVSTLDDSESGLLNQWYREGTAAGHHGDYYDNRDSGHSRLKLERYPQLRAITYLPPEIEKGLDWGAQRVLLPFPVIGNSSTASAPTQAGSIARIYYTSAGGLNLLHAQYRTNNLYVYPEHRDHDPGGPDAEGYGDLFPTNTPYLVVSQGSSGSDRPFVHAFIKTLAAFKPEVKTTLLRTRLLMPALQAIFRHSNRMGRSRAGYLSGRQSYADPRLTAKKIWRDVYHYDEAGTLTGWRRHMDWKWVDFMADGSRILKRDPSGAPIEVAPVQYKVDPKTGLLNMADGG